MSMPSTSLPSKSLVKFSPDFVGRIGGSVRLKHVWLRNCNATKLWRVFLNALLFTQYWHENGPTSQPEVLSVEKWNSGFGKLKIVFLFGTAEILEGPYKKKHPEISCLAGRLVSGSWSNIGSSSSSESSFRDTNFRFIPIIMLLPDLASFENSEIIDHAREMFSTNCSWLNTSEPLQTLHLPTNSWLPAVKSVDLINHLIKGLTINSR